MFSLYRYDPLYRGSAIPIIASAETASELVTAFDCGFANSPAIDLSTCIPSRLAIKMTWISKSITLFGALLLVHA